MSKVKIFSLFLVAFFSKTQCFSSLELLNVAVDRSDPRAVQLILMQITLSPNEKQYFLHKALVISKKANEAIKQEENHLVGLKRFIGGFFVMNAGANISARGYLEESTGMTTLGVSILSCGLVVTFSGLSDMVSRSPNALAEDAYLVREIIINAPVKDPTSQESA